MSFKYKPDCTRCKNGKLYGNWYIGGVDCVLGIKRKKEPKLFCFAYIGRRVLDRIRTMHRVRKEIK